GPADGPVHDRLARFSFDQLVGEQSHRPVSPAFRSVAAGLGNQAGLRFGVELGHLTGARPLIEGIQPTLNEALPYAFDRRSSDAERRGNLFVSATVGGFEQNPRACDFSRRMFPRA